jgi:DNA-binding NtrC family response regulator
MPSLSLAVQAKLLKALEDRSIRRVGGNRMISIDARIIAATNTDLRALVACGRFREDLYHRLDLFRVKLPPLRARDNDIVALAETLVGRIARNHGMVVRAIPASGQARLRAYRWPGNVRELAHEIERSLVFDDDALSFSALANAVDAQLRMHPWLEPHFRFPESGFSLEAAIDVLMHQALAQAGGNVSAAARFLGVSRDYIRYRLKGGLSADAPISPE